MYTLFSSLRQRLLPTLLLLFGTLAGSTTLQANELLHDLLETFIEDAKVDVEDLTFFKLQASKGVYYKERIGAASLPLP